MDDTAQPEMAAETDTIAEGAEAFKIALGQAPERPRDDKGRFAPAEAEEAAEEEEINAEEGKEPSDAASEEETEGEEEAAGEAQPDPADMPSSWSKEDAEIWTALPPEAKARIAEREGQREIAVNQKFQEAANLRKAHEAEISEATASKQKAIEAADMALSLLQPKWPSPTMLDYNSSDYDPDAYHLQRAQAEQQQSYLSNLAAQRQELAAQEQTRQEQEAASRAADLNRVTGPAFIADFPEANDAAKAPSFFSGLVEYALKSGAPADFFQSGPVTAVEWHMIAKARKYDELQQAKAKVKSDPKPEPRKAQPAVRPGVTTPKSAVDQSRRRAAHDRLAREGSVEAGAAVWKNFLR